jgi:hypothetical protein
LACRRDFTSGGRHVADAGGIEVGRQNDGTHPRHVAGEFDVHTVDDAVCHPAAHHDAVELVRPVQVVGVAAFAAQQHRILFPRHRLPDGEFPGCQQ